MFRAQGFMRYSSLGLYRGYVGIITGSRMETDLGSRVFELQSP